MSKFKRAVIIDLSECDQVRAGMSGDRAPRAVFPSIVGEAPAIRRGDAFEWKPLATALHGVYKAMDLHVGADPVLLALPTGVDMAQRGHLARVAFADLKVPALLMVDAAVAVLRASRRSSGVVALFGDEDTRVTAVRDDEVIASRRLDLGGRRLSGDGGDASLDYDEELQTAPTLRHPIVAAAILDHLPDAYFKPNLLGLEQDGIHTQVLAVIAGAPATIGHELAANVLLAGSAAGFPGIDVRLARELRALAPEGLPVKVDASPEHAVHLGGASLASLSTFEEMWITAPDFERVGPRILETRRR
ncbi:MAG: hypothetical protein R3B09_05540 [Nannocystaceae bacterium]